MYINNEHKQANHYNYGTGTRKKNWAEVKIIKLLINLTSIEPMLSLVYLKIFKIKIYIFSCFKHLRSMITTFS